MFKILLSKLLPKKSIVKELKQSRIFTATTGHGYQPSKASEHSCNCSYCPKKQKPDRPPHVEGPEITYSPPKKP